MTPLKAWPKSNDYCKQLAVNGLMGWRLPTLAEVIALYGSRALVSNKADKKYWNFRYATWTSDLHSTKAWSSVILGDGKVADKGVDTKVGAISCVHENGDL